MLDINREIITFKSPREMLAKVKVLLEKDNTRVKIATAGNERFKKEHSSHKRIQYIIEEINKI